MSDIPKCQSWHLRMQNEFSCVILSFSMTVCPTPGFRVSLPVSLNCDLFPSILVTKPSQTVDEIRNKLKSTSVSHCHHILLVCLLFPFLQQRDVYPFLSLVLLDGLFLLKGVLLSHFHHLLLIGVL